MVSILLAGIEPFCPRQRTRLLPQLLTRTGTLNRSSRWRLHIGNGGRLQSEFAALLGNDLAFVANSGFGVSVLAGVWIGVQKGL
jgi:hypothetical protein